MAPLEDHPRVRQATAQVAWRRWFSLLGEEGFEGGRPACSLDQWEFAHCQRDEALTSSWLVSSCLE